MVAAETPVDFRPLESLLSETETNKIWRKAKGGITLEPSPRS